MLQSIEHPKPRPIHGPEQLGNKPTTPKDMDKLWEVSKKFESMFLSVLYKSMRKTVPETQLTKQSPGRKMFTEMLDWEYARLHSDRKGAGPSETSTNMASMIYRNLKRRGESVEAMDQLKGIEGNRFAGMAMAMPGVTGFNQTSYANQNPKELTQAQLEGYLQQASRETGVDVNLLRSVVRHESNGNPQAVSHAGAKGLMQLMDSTAKELNVRDVFNPQENIRGGARYLKSLLKRYNGDEAMALAGYNAGPGAVERHGGIPPYPETREYVKRVLQTKQAFLGESFNKDVTSGDPAK